MYKLTNAETGAEVGLITDEQFEFLSANLEEESLEDRDYYIAAIVVEAMAASGADPGLISLLRTAVGDHDGVDLRWNHA